MSELLRTEHVVKKFASHLALDDVSISVDKGSIFGLLGPNGAGKTTLIRIINQITGPDTGAVYFAGQPLKPEDVEKIGYLPEERGLYKKMGVGEQAVYLAQLKGMSKKDATGKLKEWFDKYDILPWWGKKVEELSKGMQQKVQFIVTILHKPELLIFDEPFSGFDPINANLIKQEILSLRESGSTIIFSTHNMGSVEELCDDIALINKSKVILAGKVNKVKQQFKSNIFEIGFEETTELAIPALNNFDLIPEGITAQTLRVKLRDGENPNQLLQALIGSTHIVSFNEIIPCMNDIFIQQVTSNNKELTE